MALWTVENPGDGDTDTVAAQSAELRSLAAILENAVIRYDEAVAAVSSQVWGGQSARSWRDLAADVRGRQDALHRELHDRARTLDRYLNAVEDIAQRAVTHQRSLREALDVKADGRPATPNSLQRAFLSDSQEDAIAQRQATYDRACAEEQTAMTHLRNLSQEREEADQALRAALTPLNDERWLALGGLMLDLGITTPSRITTDNLGDGFARAVLDLIEGDRDWDDEEWEAFASFLSAFSDDDDVMRAFYDELGPERTVDLFSLLAVRAMTDDAAGDQAWAIALSLREGLATASMTWTPGYADRFAAGMCVIGAPPVITFIFGDPHGSPMGAEFARAFADIMDDAHRLGADAEWLQSGPLGQGLLARMEAADASAPAGLVPAIFQTLAQYPDTLAGWLGEGCDPHADPRHAYPRIDYWFSQHDWVGEGDGFSTPTLMWAGLQGATGGPCDPTSFDPEVWRSLAAYNSAIAAALTAHPQALVENFSLDAQFNLSAALGQMLPLLAECTLDANPKGDTLGRLLTFPGGEALWVPDITKGALGVLFGIAGSSPDGYEGLNAVISQYQTALYGAALDGSGYDPNKALTLIAQLQGYLDGATEGAQIGAYQRSQEQREAMIENLSDLVGLIPIPGTKQATAALAEIGARYLEQEVAQEVASRAVGAAQSWAVQQGVGVAVGDLMPPEGDAIRREVVFQSVLTAMIRDLPSAHWAHEGSSEQWADSLMSQYRIAADAAAKAAENSRS